VVSEVPGGVPISALREIGLLNLLRTIAQALPEPSRRVSLVIPYAAAGVLADVYAQGRVLRRENRPEGMAVDVEVPAAVLGRLRPYLANAPIG